MSLAYVDSSWVVAVALGEPGESALRDILQSFDAVFSADLLEAEVRSALARERVGAEEAERHLKAIERVRCGRRLTPEIDRVLAAGYVRGADLWHLASALYLSPEPRNLAFLTLDRAQKGVARKLGFRSRLVPRQMRT